jgi:signal transduction histidine kinase
VKERLNRQFDSESKRLFQDILLAVWAITIFYTIFYWLAGIPFAAASVGIGVFVFTPVTFLLERSGHGSIARYLFLISANFYIFMTSLALNHQVHAEYYAVPAVMLGLLIGDREDWKFITFATLLPLLSWLLMGVVDANSLPPSWRHEVAWITLFSSVNFIGSFALALLFLAIFTRTLRDQRMQMISAAKMSSLGEMAGGIAHEINNPLAIIAGKAGLMKLRLSRPDIDLEVLRKDLSKIEDTANRISRITNGLRTFSRTSEQDPMTVESLKKIFDDTVELCSERFRQNNIDLQIDVPENLKAKCRAVQLSQVFMNLFGNAFDAVEKLEDPWVRVDVAQFSNKVQIRFTDAGNGIPIETLGKIMDPFFTTKPAGRGTGLGLSISSTIVEEHGGRIFYDDSSKNTCFVVELPEVLNEAA